MWLYLDDNRIVAVNASDMDGNTGWTEVTPCSLTPESVLTDEKGAALYKLVGDKVKTRTKAEREADWPPEPEPAATIEDVVDALNALTEFVIGGE